MLDTQAGQPQATRSFSRRLFGYLLKDYLLILALCISGFLTLFLISALYDDLPDFTDQGISLWVASRYFILLVPDFLLAIIPMSLLLAAMYTVASLSKNNELTAIRASGISIVQAALPIFLVAAVCTVAQFFLAESLAPVSRREAISYKERLTDSDKHAEQKRPDYVAYRSKESNRDWLFGHFDPEGESRDVLVKQYSPAGTLAWELNAATARHLGKAEGWLFTDAMIRIFDAEGEYPVGPRQSYERLVRQDLTENPGSISFTFLLGPAESLTLGEMLAVMRDDSAVVSAGNLAIIETQFYYRLSLPLACMIAVLLGVPLAIFHHRGDVMRSFIVAAGLMVLYFVSAQLFVMMGKQQVLPPLVAGWLPALVFMAWGVWELKRRQ